MLMGFECFLRIGNVRACVLPNPQGVRKQERCGQAADRAGRTGARRVARGGMNKGEKALELEKM